MQRAELIAKQRASIGTVSFSSSHLLISHVVRYFAALPAVQILLRRHYCTRAYCIVLYHISLEVVACSITHIWVNFTIIYK
jgi:hypothetical protein